MISAGKDLRAVRVSAGLTQIELARALGISQSRLSLIETGYLATDFSVLEAKLAKLIKQRSEHLLALLPTPEAQEAFA